MGNRYANVRKGYAEDLADGNCYASGWERDFARFLVYLEEIGVIQGWEYEPQAFSFQGLGYKRGPFTYVPDFVVKYSPYVRKSITGLFSEAQPNRVVFIEVKGQEKGTDRSKWRRFRKHSGYPLEVVKRDKMILIQKNYKSVLPSWESNVY